MKKKRFSDEQLQRASGIDITAMLQGQGEKLKKQGRVYRWMRYDSTVIDRNRWYRHSREIGGGPIQFMQHFYGMDFVDAVKYLLNGEEGAEFVQASRTPEPKLPFTPPKLSKNMHRTFAYLIKTRKIDADIVQYFVDEKKILETEEYHIIKEMLKAPIIMPNGEKIYPTKGTPQGGILSPILSNIVLNELDWWIASQWEIFETHTKYETMCGDKLNRGNVYRVLKQTNLKEMFIVRYADDFKIFCRTRNDADKTFVAVKQWLADRLKLEINIEKSKVINLKNSYSEFLGFKLKAVKKGKQYVVKSHMSDKAIKIETQKLKEKICDLQRPKNLLDEKRKLNEYNSMVFGIHNYYKICNSHIRRLQ